MRVFAQVRFAFWIRPALQRHRPAVVVITDGGAPERLEQSRRCLEFIGSADRVRYLGFSELSFYDALLDRDYEFFFNVASAVQAEIERVQPEQIFCDAVEFYNPVHDVTLPIVKRAARVLPRAQLFEVPLVYQLPGPAEQYSVQRVPAALQERRFAYLSGALSPGSREFEDDPNHKSMNPPAPGSGVAGRSICIGEIYRRLSLC
jgi:hypothetical protein